MIKNTNQNLYLDVLKMCLECLSNIIRFQQLLVKGNKTKVPLLLCVTSLKGLWPPSHYSQASLVMIHVVHSEYLWIEVTTIHYSFVCSRTKEDKEDNFVSEKNQTELILFAS